MVDYGFCRSFYATTSAQNSGVLVLGVVRLYYYSARAECILYNVLGWIHFTPVRHFARAPVYYATWYSSRSTAVVPTIPIVTCHCLLHAGVCIHEMTLGALGLRMTDHDDYEPHARVTVQ